MTKPRIVAYTRWSTGGRGEYPFRYVVLDWGPRAAQRYSRHEHINDRVHKDFFASGHYFSGAEDAVADLAESVRRNRRNYGEGNISRIPTFSDGAIMRIAGRYGRGRGGRCR